MNLQLIYLTINIDQTAIGVMNKITAKCEKFNEQNSPCDWVNINEYTKSVYINNKLILSFENNKILIDFFNEFSNGKIIIFRHVDFSDNIYHLLKNKISISEHNTIELYEWLNIYKHYKFKDWVYLLRTFEIKSVLNKLFFYTFTAKKKYKVFSGFIGVTEEIRAYQEKKYYGKLIPSSVISNGVKKRTSIDIDIPIID
jgi:hypothetical protein